MYGHHGFGNRGFHSTLDDRWPALRQPIENRMRPYAWEHGLSNAMGRCVPLPVGDPGLGENRETRFFGFFDFWNIPNQTTRHGQQQSFPSKRTDSTHGILQRFVEVYLKFEFAIGKECKKWILHQKQQFVSWR